MNIHATVLFQENDRHFFTGEIHEMHSPDEFHLDPAGFYQKFGKAIPDGTHYEIEIVVPNEETLARHRLHAEKSRKTGKPFMCYPRHIPTPDRFIRLFTIWCLGSTLKIVHGLDLNTVLDDECHGDEELFIAVLRERYGIRIAGG